MCDTYFRMTLICANYLAGGKKTNDYTFSLKII
jgi:hypothetical protein